MSIYKKGINTLDSVRNLEYVMSNNSGIYMSQAVIGENVAPYHGLFIKQNEKQDEIYLSKLIEQIKIGTKLYTISDLCTNEENYGGVEYLESFDRYPVPSFKYNINSEVCFEKTYTMSPDNVLCINYDIENMGTEKVNIKVLPLANKRNIFNPKRESMLKLNADKVEDGCKVTLSILEKKYLYLKSLESNFVLKPHYINGINYTYSLSKDDTKTYLEDVYVPGYFEFNIKPKSKFNVSIFVSLNDIDILKKEYNQRIMYNNQIEKNKMMTIGIDENFYELKHLALSAGELNYIDNEQKKFVLLNSMPNVYKNSEHLKQTIKSIHGNYILLNRNKEAYRILDSIKYRIEKEKEEYTKKDYYEILFMYIEALAKYFNLEVASAKEKIDIYMYVREKITEILNNDKDFNILDESYIVTIDDKKYLAVNIYWYNALKIYLNISEPNDEYASKVYEITEKLKDNLIDVFYDDENRVLKYEASEDAYASSDMLLAMDLSNPLIHDKIAMKVIDTAFKELYTPYGIRNFSIKSDKYDGYVYPYLMASFVNGNLRLNGVTRASQKIAYNLVKELLMEINKKTVGTIKYRYDEKSKKAYGMPINSLTNSEIIRLYNMLI